MIEVHGRFRLIHFYEAMGTLEALDKQGATDLRVFIHPDDLGDLDKWDIYITGHSFKERLVEAEQDRDSILTFGQMTFYQNDQLPLGLVILITPSGYVESLVRVKSDTIENLGDEYGEAA